MRNTAIKIIPNRIKGITHLQRNHDVLEGNVCDRDLLENRVDLNLR